MKRIITGLSIGIVIVTITILGINSLNNCINVQDNAVSECFDTTLINSIMVVLGFIGISYIAIILYKFNKPLANDEKQKMVNDYYDYLRDTKPTRLQVENKRHYDVTEEENRKHRDFNFKNNDSKKFEF